mmetsp:Transcript_16004/g.20318  ORF Transcript_16004/g.20318 Transcript_16004/m.20318 type:complete len:96 (-) Transcript_16004:154-441(-)|eukprot:CAMPEP_0203642938 /NCGR_PEP_ID=MMETSP0088-20131115/8358_1 /ASSEMBLY_ACC=CAM_ASM_001087 /TAXON_ID=426623 /ORGANISM="Chaetoceros affinis, Strain CCMP159" /LENGTH=95 /DNA_ID=CAMNT_0050498935 /DNA_START=43 /DNA_END=330 /DNA_ORIENTATION=-
MDEQIKALQTRIESIEKVNQFKADQEAVHKVQMDMLTTLRTIRAAMVADSGNSGGDSKELARLKEENEELKKVNKKHEYRIQHLVDNMEKMLEGK